MGRGGEERGEWGGEVRCMTITAYPPQHHPLPTHCSKMDWPDKVIHIATTVQPAGGLEGLTASLSVSPFRTLSRYSCLISLSSLEGRPGYMVEPPDRTMCL